ncbi:hypothetical protein [Aeromicrobium massiliense]|uniref:hypothetical protein n=1 Tax=Aeromicrobium massiliense TaxID=1464554 RepID=UPI0002DE0FBE|nr:hypothetical protein [Aeromicrobium massiliense]
MRLITGLVTTALAVGTVLGTSTAAQAQQSTIKDKRADVLRFDSIESDSYTRLDSAASKKSGVDAKSVRFDHGRKNVTITVRFSRLKSGSTIYAEFVRAGKKKPSFELYGYDKQGGDVYNARDKKVCNAKVRTSNGKNGTIRATVRRSCLGNPAKLRISVGVLRLSGGSAESPGYSMDVLSSKKVLTPERSRLLKSS